MANTRLIITASALTFLIGYILGSVKNDSAEQVSYEFVPDPAAVEQKVPAKPERHFISSGTDPYIVNLAMRSGASYATFSDGMVSNLNRMGIYSQDDLDAFRGFSQKPSADPDSVDFARRSRVSYDKYG